MLFGRRGGRYGEELYVSGRISWELIPCPIVRFAVKIFV